MQPKIVSCDVTCALDTTAFIPNDNDDDDDDANYCCTVYCLLYKVGQWSKIDSLANCVM